VIHELATESMKFGALSVPSGTLDLSSAPDGADISLTWLQRGRPTASPPETGWEGFGGKLVRRSVTGQLGGPIDHDRLRGGLIVTLRLRPGRLASRHAGGGRVSTAWAQPRDGMAECPSGAGPDA
jgi:two-component sensor histidine kinase